MSAIVPWNDPGETPCCCGVCTSETFFASTSTLPVWSQQITPELYNTLRLLNSSSTNYALNVQVKLNMGISTAQPLGYGYNFSQTLGQTYENFNRDAPVRLGGCDLALALSFNPNNFNAGVFPVVFPLWNGSFFLTTGLRVSFWMWVRDGGGGYPGTSPAPSANAPMMYVQGQFSISDFTGSDPAVKPNFFPPDQPSSVRFTFDDAGGTSNNVNILGYSAKHVQSFNANGGNHDIDWKVFLTAPPP